MTSPIPHVKKNFNFRKEEVLYAFSRQKIPQPFILFMAHSDLDDNVHMQNTVQLISKLMDLEKEFSFMLYPDQRHGFRGKKREHSNYHFVSFWFKHFLNRGLEN